MLTKNNLSESMSSELSNDVSDVLIAYLGVNLRRFESKQFLTDFQIVDIILFHYENRPKIV